MIVAVIIVFISFFLLVAYSCLRVSAREDKYAAISYKNFLKKQDDAVRDNNKNLFCLAANKPVSVLDFKTLNGCSPEKCMFCKMSTFIDLE